MTANRRKFINNYFGTIAIVKEAMTMSFGAYARFWPVHIDHMLKLIAKSSRDTSKKLLTDFFNILNQSRKLCVEKE
ncbi:hypothetical protein QTP86_001224 [Hemibagrus guttatus]|nr:hypothetical protein QTP86_001224 [Hemibagrus guttatus]